MYKPVVADVDEVSLESSEACFVYQPASSEADVRHNKKHRASNKGNRNLAHRTACPELPPLLNGRELPGFAKARLAALHKAWSEKEAQLENAVDSANADTISQICNFVLEPKADSHPRQVPAGLINAGLASSTSGSMFESIARSLRSYQHTIILRITASDCHNLKAALKTIISRGTMNTPEEPKDRDDDDTIESRQLLNYDLQALHHHIRRYEVQRCILFFQNSEALDPQVLSELVDILVSWRDRIPFFVLFEMAISVDLFQDKLARTTLRHLHGAMFESKTSRDILDLLFSVATCDKKSALFMGPSVSKMLLDQQTDRIASVKSFVSTLKYCYMMHFFNNPMSFLCAEAKETDLQKDHADYLRSLPSFSRHIDMLKGDGRGQDGRLLMQDDAHLLKEARVMLQVSRQNIEAMQDALKLLLLLNKHTSTRNYLTHSSLYIKALAGELGDSHIVRELLLSVRRLASDRMFDLLLDLQSSPVLNAKDLDSSISWLRARADKRDPLVRSVYDAEHETIRAAVEGHKVVLTKGEKESDPQTAAYTKLVDRIDLILVSCLAKTLISVRDINFHEIIVFDGKGSCRDILTAAPRASVERALSRPHDYLACECCDMVEGQLAATQPTVALLYQLYLESGATINIQDLWLAFRAIQGLDGDEDGDVNEEQTLALFHRALAELRYLGMLKNNKRKADHLAKLRWKGL